MVIWRKKGMGFLGFLIILAIALIAFYYFFPEQTSNVLGTTNNALNSSAKMISGMIGNHS